MKQCAICGKGSIIRGARKKLRSNYNPTPKKKKTAQSPMDEIRRRRTGFSLRQMP